MSVTKMGISDLPKELKNNNNRKEIFRNVVLLQITFYCFPTTTTITTTFPMFSHPHHHISMVMVNGEQKKYGVGGDGGGKTIEVC